MKVQDLAQTSYDQVEYDSFPFPQSHPDRLATIATLLGMTPKPLADCRVLELGCSSGGNLIPIAEQFPDSQFVGVDASAKAIEKGTNCVEELGLINIELKHCDILDIDASFGQFDYIIIHGVYSWVPLNVQEKILQIFAERMNPNGVAYVSYNTYPGWHFRGMIRDVMAYHAKFFESPQEQLAEARSLVNFLSKSVPVDNNPYGMLLSRELELLQDKHNYYLYHEFLEEYNEPIYFHQFADRLQQAGLQYLGEADFSSMSASNFPGQVERMLRTVSNDTIRMEQYMDFVRNRMFRQTLVCHQSQKLNRDISYERLLGLYLATNAAPEGSEGPDGRMQLRSHEPTKFTRPGSTMTTREPLVKAAMQYLAEQWPRAVSFRELVVAARRLLNPSPQLLDPQRVRQEQEIIALPMIRCFATTHVDLTFTPGAFAKLPSEQPATSKLARYQAQSANRVTNLCHQTVNISDLQRHLLQRLDGNHDRTKLVDFLVVQVEQGKLIAHEAGDEIRDPIRIRENADRDTRVQSDTINQKVPIERIANTSRYQGDNVGCIALFDFEIAVSDCFGIWMLVLRQNDRRQKNNAPQSTMKSLNIKALSNQIQSGLRPSGFAIAYVAEAEVVLFTNGSESLFHRIRVSLFPDRKHASAGVEIAVVPGRTALKSLCIHQCLMQAADSANGIANVLLASQQEQFVDRVYLPTSQARTRSI